MSDPIAAVLDPFVRRGLFESPETAVAILAQEYILRQIQRYQARIEALQAKHGMSYEQFEAYLASRAATLAEQPTASLSQAVMIEEEDAFEWKVARDMLQSWLGLRGEVSA